MTQYGKAFNILSKKAAISVILRLMPNNDSEHIRILRKYVRSFASPTEELRGASSVCISAMTVPFLHVQAIAQK
jgi:hypothetical protein